MVPSGLLSCPVASLPRLGQLDRASGFGSRGACGVYGSRPTPSHWWRRSVSFRQIKAKALRRALGIGRPSIPAPQLQALWAMAQEDPDGLARRFGASKVMLVSRTAGRPSSGGRRDVQAVFFAEGMCPLCPPDG